jgi:hypothetical protein
MTHTFGIIVIGSNGVSSAAKHGRVASPFATGVQRATEDTPLLPYHR